MVRYPMRSLLAALSLLLLTVLPAAAQSGVIVGRVTDEQTGEPVGSARVEALSGAGRQIATAFTTADGNFRMTGVPAGTYNVSIASVGYADRVLERVIVTAGQTTTVNSQLAPTAFVLAPLSVTGTRGGIAQKITEAPSSIAVVAQEAIEERPAVSMTEHLRNVQGVDVINAGVQSHNVVVRGFNNIFSGSLHMLTDFRIAAVPSLRVNFMHFVPQTNDDLQRMEVVLGPASALFGPNTANGVLHMITKSPFDEQQTTFSVTGGERDLLHVTGRTSQLITPTLGFKVSGQFMRADDWQFIDPVEEATRQDIAAGGQRRALVAASMPRNADGTPLTAEEIDRRLDVIGQRDFDLQRWSGDARLDWRPSSDLSTVLSAGRTMSNRGLELTGIGAGQVRNWAYDYVQARTNWRRLFAQAYLNTSNAGETYLLRTGSPIVDRSKLFAGQLQHGLDIGTMQSFTYGVDYIRTMPETEGTIHGSREADDLMQEWGGYLQSTTRLTPQFDLVLAGRVDDHSHLPDLVFSPRAALVFKPVEDQSFRVTFNRAFSTPSSLNLFLDIDAGWPNPALGVMGYRLRALAPGAGGISFRDGQGQLYGMRSPSAGFVQAGADGATRLDIQSVALYRLQIENFLRAAQAAGQPVPEQIAQLLRSFQLDPALPAAFLALNPYTGTLGSPADVQDVPGIRESITQSFEVGYKGLIGERVLLGADVWFDRKENFTSPLIPQSPMLLMHPQQLAGYLVPRLTAAFMAGGMPQQQAQATAEAMATNIVQVPGAVLASPDAPATAADVLATYRNFGEVNLWGIDLGASANLTRSLQLNLTASFVSDDHFILPLDGVDQVVALNAPKRKGTVGLNYRNMTSGWNGEIRLRHNAEYPVNSAGYVGMQCVDFTFGPTVRNEECVQSFNLLDVAVGYRLPMMRGASIQLNVQNLLNEDFRAFVGTPTIGRLALLRLKYDF
jgi:outer membrane receptor for ferrienterochelin and colicins